MEWFKDESVQKPVKYLIQRKTLSIQGISSKANIVSYRNEKSENSKTDVEEMLSSSSRHTISEMKKIHEYYIVIEEIDIYCKQIFEKFKERFCLFASHPLFRVFMKKIRQNFDKEWNYNFTILAKDLKFVREMREILRNIIENPSREVDFSCTPVENYQDWRMGLNSAIDEISNTSISQKIQVKSYYYKLRNKAL